ncbi:MAG: phage holin family protein, partial [bacterium]|nr:phage holin family protein [bacterium]
MVTQERRSVGASFGELAHDITVLVELQAKLAALDVKESVGRLIVPIVLAVLGVCAILGCFPVLMFAGGYAIHAAGLPLHWAFLIAASAGLLLGLGLLGLSWIFLRNAFN